MERLAGRIILLWGWRRALVAFLAGAIAVLGQAPYDFLVVGFVAFPLLVWLLDGATPSPSAGWVRGLLPAFSVGWWFGFGYFVAGLWWVGGALLVEADAFAWALPLAIVGLPALLAFFFAFAAALARTVWSDGIGRIAALALGFGAAEWLRTILLTGFPWNPVGFMAMPIPLLMQSVSVVGTAGMNMLAVFVFAMPALLAAKAHRRFGAALAVLLAVAHAGFGYWSLSRPQPANSRQLSVRIVQPDIDQSEKWDGEVRDRIFRTLLDLSIAPPQDGSAKPDLIIWPETSVPFLLTDRPDALVAIADLLAPGQMLLAGVVRQEGGNGPESRYYNSVAAINDAGVIVDAVDKVHLVPFGEYLPFQDWLEGLGIQKIVTLPMDFSAGAKRHALSLPGGIKGVPFICYEIIFPTSVARDAVSSDVIIVVTNDAWFGDTAGPYQHFRQAQIRAVENAKPVLRAANTGISGIIDARGRVVDGLAIGAKGAIDKTVSVGTLARIVPSPTYGGWTVMALLALILAVAALRRRTVVH
ncbi:MAG: apolipoprotein N-acyltransferase [Rhizobiaceae bacterium]|nr:apolipoprotein N-acyltransferase [Rhizobiaceae bacterium]